MCYCGFMMQFSGILFSTYLFTKQRCKQPLQRTSFIQYFGICPRKCNTTIGEGFLTHLNEIKYNICCNILVHKGGRLGNHYALCVLPIFLAKCWSNLWENQLNTPTFSCFVTSLLISNDLSSTVVTTFFYTSALDCILQLLQLQLRLQLQLQKNNRTTDHFENYPLVH